MRRSSSRHKPWTRSLVQILQKTGKVRQAQGAFELQNVGRIVWSEACWEGAEVGGLDHKGRVCPAESVGMRGFRVRHLCHEGRVLRSRQG